MLSVSTVHSLFVKQPSSENNNAAWSKSVPTSYIHKLLEHFWDLPGDLDGKESACSGGNRGSTTGLGISPGVGNGNPLQYSCLENPMDRGAWQAAVHGVARVRHDLATKPPPPSRWHKRSTNHTSRPQKQAAFQSGCHIFWVSGVWVDFKIIRDLVRSLSYIKAFFLQVFWKLYFIGNYFKRFGSQRRVVQVLGQLAGFLSDFYTSYLSYLEQVT